MPPTTDKPRVYLQKLADTVPDGFRFGFKVTNAVTRNQSASFTRFLSAKAGNKNAELLNAGFPSQPPF